MKAIVVEQDELRVGEVPVPELCKGALRIRVVAAGINRADLMQRRGFYPPPPGASEVLGLECAGEVVEVADGVEGWRPGDRAMALLAGGGYAAEVVVDAGSALHVPDAFSWAEAAVFPEVYLTVFSNVFQIAGLPEGGSLLVHGGGSGIGTASIQLAKQAGARIFVTAGSAEKCARCVELGADLAIDYNTQDFGEEVATATEGAGVDVVLDSIGGETQLRSMAILKEGGILVSIVGLTPEGRNPQRNIRVTSTLVQPSSEQLGEIADLIETGVVRPIVSYRFPQHEAPLAHEQSQTRRTRGKIILEID